MQMAVLKYFENRRAYYVDYCDLEITIPAKVGCSVGYRVAIVPIELVDKSTSLLAIMARK
jgi:hypothetical protein